MSKNNTSSLGVIVSGFVLILVLCAAVYALTAGRFQVYVADEKSVAERIRPIGEVTLAGAEQAAAAAPAAAATTAAAPGAAAKSGEEIYSQSCIACHASGAAGAPKLGDKAAWEARIAQGMDALLTTAINGKNAMPPRGTCATCSDDDLKAVIEYMVSKVQ